MSAASDANGTSGQKVKSLIRGLDVLDFILDRERPVTAKQIIEHLRIPRATAFAIVRALQRRGYLWRNASAHSYEIGWQLFRLGLAHEVGSDLWREARQALAQLAVEADETVQLSVLDRDKNLVVLREGRSTKVKFMFGLGVRTPINWSASGCLLVSDYSDTELRSRLSGELPPSPTGRAPTAIEPLIDDVRRFRAQGYAIKLGHVHEDVGMIAAPVFGPDGHLEAAITIVAHHYGVAERRRQQLLAKARRTADDLSHRLGADIVERRVSSHR
jgi:DNA-binding IclR family transcriptional regulator